MAKSKTKKKNLRRLRIRRGIRSKIEGTAERPRMSIFRSNRDIYVQLINDRQGHTLAAASSRDADLAAHSKLNKTEQAKKVGEKVANVAKEAGITQVVFDRGGFLYHGRVKALADAARAGGLQF